MSSRNTLQTWSSPPRSLTLIANEVHVWHASLDQTAYCIQSLYQTLTIDEQSRAERFHFQKDRMHFILARAFLRAILSRYVGIPPSHLRFCYNGNGKPALNPEHCGHTLRFNLSHSQGLALYAITQNQDIGIDLEHIRTDFPWREIAARFFSPRENAALQSLPSNQQIQAFFSCWTRKEAYIKAVGKGLAIPLDQFDVSLIPGKPAALLYTEWNPQEAGLWYLQELVPAPNYVAALAVKGTLQKLQCWQWSLPG